jgi:hypothetical protein
VTAFHPRVAVAAVGRITEARDGDERLDATRKVLLTDGALRPSVGFAGIEAARISHLYLLTTA